MGQKIKDYRHGMNLNGNYITNLKLADTPVDGESIINKFALDKAFVYNSDAAIAYQNTFHNIGGLSLGTVVKGKTISDLLDMMFFETSEILLRMPETTDSLINIISGGQTVGYGTLASPLVINRFIDYDAAATITLMIKFRRNDAGLSDSLIINGVDYYSRISLSYEENGTVERIEITLPLREILTDLNVRTIDISLGYKEGQIYRDPTNTYEPKQILAGNIAFPQAVTFENIGYPAFWKVIELGAHIPTTFNYQTDADGRFYGNNFVNKPVNKVMVIGLPVQGGYVGYTVYRKSINVTDRAIRRDINISSGMQSGQIPYKIYYFFLDADKPLDDFGIGIGADLAQSATSDAVTFMGVTESLICLNKGVDNTARYTQVEYYFGTRASGFMMKNEGFVPDTTSTMCEITPSSGGVKLSDLSTNRFPSLEQLYQTVVTNNDCLTQLSNGNEPVYKVGDKAMGEFGNDLQAGFSIYEKNKGFGVMELRLDGTYAYHKWPQAILSGVYEWKVVPSSGSCEILLGQSTGKFVYNQIELYIDGQAQGIFKDNVPADQDYIESKYTSQCLQLTTNLGTGFENQDKKYPNISTANGNLAADKTAISNAPKVEYWLSSNTGLVYTKNSAGDIEKAGKSAVYFTMVFIAGTYYKIIQINSDSSYQLHYYNDYATANVPIKWIGEHESSLCVVGYNGQYTGMIHYNDIRAVYADTMFNTPVQGIAVKPNGTGGDTVADEASDLCKSNLDAIEHLTYETLKNRITNQTLAENKKYMITDFQTVSSYSYNNSSPVILRGAVEPLIVTATSKSTLDINASSVLYPNDMIHYVSDLNTKNALYTGAEFGYITYRKDTINNSEYDFDMRGLLTLANPSLGENGHKVVPLDVIMTIQDSKVFLRHNKYDGARNATGCSVYFDGQVNINNSIVRVHGGEIMRFTEDLSGKPTYIINSTLDIGQVYTRTYPAAGQSSDNPPSAHFRGSPTSNTFAMSMHNCMIKCEIMSLYTSSKSENCTTYNARNWAGTLGQFVMGIKPIETLTDLGQTPNISVTFSNENDNTYNYPIIDIYPQAFQNYNPNCRCIAQFVKTEAGVTGYKFKQI